MDPTQTPDQINQLTAAQNAATDATTKSTAATNDYITSLSKIKVPQAINDLVKGYEQYVDQAKHGTENTAEFKTSLDNLYNGATKTLALFSKFDGFKNFSVQGGAAVNSMASQFENLTSRMGGVSNVAAKLGGSFLTAFAKDGAAAVQVLLNNIQNAEKLEKGYLNLLGASGQLGNAWKQMNNDLTNLDGMVAKFSTNLADTAHIMGLSLQEVSQYASQAKNIPGIFDQIVNSAGPAGENINGFTTALKLSVGASTDVSTVLKVMEQAYENIGNANGKVNNSTTKGAELFAQMAQTSQDLNIRFADTENYLGKVSEMFKDVGDNTQGATNILGRFMSSLRDTGLTTKASIDIIGGMVRAVKDLDIGTKALISQRNGGPGGLQGSFQIDQLLRNGKTDQVVSMVQNALKQQFRGKIYTQEEAANSPQAASQFFRQRTMLQSGAFGKLAGNDETATRLLEAMAKGDTSGGGEIVKSSMNAVQNQVKQGTEITNRQLTVLNDLNNSLDRSDVVQTQSLMSLLRIETGITGSSKYAEETQENLRKIQEQQAGKTGQTGLTDVGVQHTNENREGLGGVLRSFGGLKEGMGNVAKSIFSSAKETVKSPTVAEHMAAHGQEDTKRAIGRASGREMRLTPRLNPGTAMPKAAETVNHEITLKPLEVRVKIDAPDGMNADVSTNYDPVQEANDARFTGGIRFTPKRGQ